jgi:ubiquinone/menaquinone biosynthesis C-methylase UbiE
MKTKWDYTSLAEAYLKRPPYAEGAVDRIVSLAGLEPGDPVCDVGAGVAHLTIPLAVRKLDVTAVEPNDSMRALGVRRTKAFSNVLWHEGTGEKTGQGAGMFKLVTFGSSFNVTDRAAALQETSRILKTGGWFACLWNHRDLDDPLQAKIEAAIKKRVKTYDYGTRREDQTAVIERSGLFDEVQSFEASVTHAQSVADCLEAWASHATLQRQAGKDFAAVLRDIEAVVKAHGRDPFDIPYTTRVWAARSKA